MQRLSQELCAQKAAECRRLAEQASKQSHRIMLESIAETWERISNSLTDSRSGLRHLTWPLWSKEVINFVSSRRPQILEKRKSPSAKPPIVK
jgi:hypothetical protein